MALNLVNFGLDSATIEIPFSVFLKFLKFLFPLLVLSRLELYILTFVFQDQNISLVTFNPHSVDVKSLGFGSHRTWAQVKHE